MFSKKHKRFGSAPFSRKDWISSSLSLELGHYIHLARAITRARASIILCLWYWVALYNGFFFFTLKKGHIPETFAFFLTFETLYTFLFLYRVSPYHLFFLFSIHLLAAISCWLTLEAPLYLLLVNHFHILLSSLDRNGYFFVQLLSLGSRPL